MPDHAIMNHRDCEPEDVILTDSRGYELTHRVLAERLGQVEYTKIMEETESVEGNRSLISTVLASWLETGFRGYHNFSTKELLDEYREVEPDFYGLWHDGSLPWDLHEEDPLYTFDTKSNQ